MAKYLSGRSKRIPQSQLNENRYQYLAVNQAEPNLGDPTAIIPTLPIGQKYQSVSIIGYPGERYWIPVSGGLIPGSISIYDEGFLTGGVSSTTQLNFVGAAITAKGYLDSYGYPGIGVTITVFSPGSQGQVIFNNNNDFKGASGLFYDNSTNYVGIGTSIPTQELDLDGDLRLRGTIYDYYNNQGSTGQLLIKNNLGGLQWSNPSTVVSGAGGTYTNIQYNSSTGLVDGAANFVFDPTTSRVGIGSTQPGYLLDVLGYSRFTGQTEINYLRVTGVATVGYANIINSNLGVTTIAYGNITNSNLGITTVGLITATSAYIGVATIGFATITNSYLRSTTVGFITATNSYIGILTVSDINIERTNLTNLNVTGIATVATLGVTGIATFNNQVNINNLSVTGVGTFDNIKLDTNTINTTSGNLFLDSSTGTTQVNDILYINDTTQSTNKDTGSIITEGGVGIEKNLNVGGQLSITGITTLASSGGITTTGGDLYVGNNLRVNSDIYYNNLNGIRGQFTEALTTKDLNVTGITTLATLKVSGLTTTKDLEVTGVSTFTGSIDANGGAYIDNIQIGITNDNTIDTTSGNLTINSAGGTTTIDSNLISSGTATFNGNVIFGNASSDTVSFTSRVSSIVLPSSNGTLDFGSSGNKWNNIYANNFVGTIAGNADTATKLLNARIISASGDFVYVSAPFDGTSNVTGVGTLANSGVTAGTYGSSTTVGIVTVDAKGRVTAASNVGINFNTATVAKADSLTTSRTISASGDFVYVSAPFNGTADVTGVGTLATVNTNTGTFGSSTTVPQITVNGKGLITGVSNISVNFNTATVAKADSLTTSRTISASGDFVYVSAPFNGTSNVTGVGTLATVNTNTGTFGSSTQIPQFSVNGKGLITSASNISVNFSAATVAKADSLTTARTIAITGDLSYTSPAFDGSQNVTATSILANSGVVAGTYGSTTTVGIVTVDAKGRVTAASNVGINFSTATVSQADRLTNTRNIAITGDLAWNVNFDGTSNVTGIGTLANSGVVAGTYGSSTTVGIVTVDAKGRITSASNVGINFSSDTIKTVTRSTAATHYLTFVDSDNVSATAESLYTNSAVSYNPNTGLKASLVNYAEVLNVIGNTGTAATINLANGNFVTATLTGNCTFSFITTYVSGSVAVAFTLLLTNDATASRSIIWPASVKWPGGTTPNRTVAANKTDVYTFFSTDNGTSWYGNLAQYNYS